MGVIVAIIQWVSALLVIGLTAAQSEKAEQGGVMGLGAAGGRTASDIEVSVGADRILKPLTRWSAVGFLFASVLGALPKEKLDAWHFFALLIVYLVVMLFGTPIWDAVTGRHR